MLRYKLNLYLSITCNLLLILAGFSSNISGKVVDQYNFKVEQRSRDITVITIDQQVHLDYGLAYPITYEFYLPNQGDEFSAFLRYRFSDNWIEMVEKTSNDFFNGIEAVRFDYIDSKAYVSVGFSSLSDSIYIMFEDGENQVEAIFDRISPYYDNRDAVVTSTADDWADWCHEKFIRTCRNFRAHNLWLSCAIVTNGVSADNWDDIQIQLDSGYVEAVAHSRTHPYVPYNDVEGEVAGSKEDIIGNLELPAHSRYGENEYVYAWIAPYGEYDEEIDSMVSASKYLITRLYYGGDHGFSDWNEDLSKFDPIGVSMEVGPLWIGTTDTSELNDTFDEVVNIGGVYHVMCHPNILEWDQEYPWVHLEHISNRKNIWYVGYGHLQVYRFLQDVYPSQNLTAYENNKVMPASFILSQNYPNPFNPKTNFRIYSHKNTFINIVIYGLKGNHIRKIINKKLSPGEYVITWDGRDDLGRTTPAGIYFLSANDGHLLQTRKMILIK